MVKNTPPIPEPQRLPTFHVLTATLGVPTSARCCQCGAEWAQPEDDPDSDTLPQWTKDHRCKHTEKR